MVLRLFPMLMLYVSSNILLSVGICDPAGGLRLGS